MKENKKLRLLAVGMSAIAATLCSAQFPGWGWQDECHAHSGTTHTSQYSTDYGLSGVENSLIGMTIGTSGTSTWGGTGGPCFDPSRGLAASGRLSFFAGPVGSVQTDFDDNMALTMGAPFDPVGDFCYAMVLKDTNDDMSLISGQYMYYTGASKRYIVHKFADDEVNIDLTVRALGDAIVLSWEITNLTDVARPLGMSFAAWPALHPTFPMSEPDSGFSTAFSFADFIAVPDNWFGPSMNYGNPKYTEENFSGWVSAPGLKPFKNGHRLARSSTRFPAYVDFLFGQSTNYGIRFLNTPDDTVKKLSVDPLDSSKFIGATSVDLITIAEYGNTIVGNEINFAVFGELPTSTKEESDTLDGTQVIAQRYPVQTVSPGQARTIVQVIKANWGVGNYNDPYAFVLDAPKVINYDTSGQNDQSPNPMRVVAYIDNQYAKLDQSVNMQSVRLVITLPADGSLALAPGETYEKTIPGVPANEIRNIEWSLVSDGVTFGDIPITVTAFPFPGPSKTLTTKIHVAASPIMRLKEGAQLVTIPYEFQDNSLGSVLGLVPEIDFRAYKWDNGQLAYVQATTAERGQGYWVVPLSDQGYVTLQNAQIPADRAQGGLLTTIHKGWNLIGNPYNYPIPLSDLVAVVDDAPADTFTWSELIANGFVASALATWQRDDVTPFSGKYVWTQGQSSYLLPHKGYWIFATTYRDIHISWPGVYLAGMSNAGRAVDDAWKQTDKQWRLQFAARNGQSSDTENFLGYTYDSKAVSRLTLPKPPVSIDSPLEVVIEGIIDGEPARVAQAMTDKKTKTEWRVYVNSEAGDVTVTWPNLATVPRNVKAKITDVATGEVRDLRTVSGYSYTMSEKGSREFLVSLEQGGAVKPVIGNVVVSGSSRDASSPITVNYALSADALVTVRVLSGTGKEVFTVTRGRADSAGENQVTWNMRDNANRAVAPGVYRVEILAETVAGERVRKMVPVNVVR